MKHFNTRVETFVPYGENDFPPSWVKQSSAQVFNRFENMKYKKSDPIFFQCNYSFLCVLSTYFSESIPSALMLWLCMKYFLPHFLHLILFVLVVIYLYSDPFRGKSFTTEYVIAYLPRFIFYAHIAHIDICILKNLMNENSNKILFVNFIKRYCCSV